MKQKKSLNTKFSYGIIRYRFPLKFISKRSQTWLFKHDRLKLWIEMFKAGLNYVNFNLINSTPAAVGENKFWKNQKQILRWLQTTNHCFIQFQKKSLLKIVLRQDPSTFSSRSATVRQYFNWSFTSVSSVVYFFEIWDSTIRSRDPWNEMGPKSSLVQMLIPSFIVSKAFSRSSLNFLSIFDL